MKECRNYDYNETFKKLLEKNTTCAIYENNIQQLVKDMASCLKSLEAYLL